MHDTAAPTAPSHVTELRFPFWRAARETLLLKVWIAMALDGHLDGEIAERAAWEQRVLGLVHTAALLVAVMTAIPLGGFVGVHAGVLLGIGAMVIVAAALYAPPRLAVEAWERSRWRALAAEVRRLRR